MSHDVSIINTSQHERGRWAEDCKEHRDEDRQPGIRGCQQLDCYPHTCDVLLFWFISPNLISKIRSTRFQGSESSQSLTHSSLGIWTSVLLRTNGNWPCQGLTSTQPILSRHFFYSGLCLPSTLTLQSKNLSTSTLKIKYHMGSSFSQPL